MKSNKMKMLNNKLQGKKLTTNEMKSLFGGDELPTWSGDCAIWYNGNYEGEEYMENLVGDSAPMVDYSCALRKGTGYSCFCNYF